MKLKKTSKKLLLLWRYRLVLCAILASLMCSWILHAHFVIGLVFSAAAIIAFPIAWLYLGKRYHAFKYEVNKNYIIIYKNVYLKKVSTFPSSKLLFLNFIATPLEKLFEINSVILNGGGAKAIISGLESSDLTLILTTLGYSNDDQEEPPVD